MVRDRDTGGRGRLGLFAGMVGTVAFLLAASISGRTASTSMTIDSAGTTTTTAAAEVTTTDTSTPPAASPTTSSTTASPTTSTVDVDHPSRLVIATATQLFGVDLTERRAELLTAIETGVGIPSERFDRVQVSADGYVYYDRIRATLRGQTFRMPIDGSGQSQLLLEAVSPATQHDPASGVTRLVTLGRRAPFAQILVSDVAPDGTVSETRSIPARANTVPELGHPSWSPAGSGSTLVVEWSAAGESSRLILVDIDRAASLDEDEFATDVELPEDADWRLPTWPSNKLRVVATSVGQRTQLVEANPADGRDHEAVADGGDIVHHDHDANGEHPIVVDRGGSVSHAGPTGFEMLDFAHVAIETDSGLSGLSDALDGPVIAADW